MNNSRVILLTIVNFFAITSGINNLKIYGGENADIEDFPYMVFLRDKYQSFCGGSIINENTVLTSAQCIMTFNPASQIRVGYGTSNNSEATYSNVWKIIQHENFQMDPPWRDDIAVLKVDPPIVFSKKSQPIKLPQKGAHTPEGKLGVFTGWGETETAVNQDVLQTINMTIFSDQACQDVWKNTYSPVNVQHNLCAESDMSDGVSRGECYGDSGGPLVFDGIQYGIASYFYQTCGNSTLPPVFTKISGYIDWLSDKL